MNLSAILVPLALLLTGCQTFFPPGDPGSAASLLIGIMVGTVVTFVLSAFSTADKKKATEAFLTGSRVYGKPGSDSDIDLVVFVSQETASKLWKMRRPGKPSLVLDNLNLIALTDRDQYEKWRLGTDLMSADSQPTSREDAVTLLKDLGVTEDTYL